MIRKNDFFIQYQVFVLVLTCFFMLFAVDAGACFRKPTPPAWVNTTLSDPDYFIGIGSAPIIKKQNDHVEKAKNDALNELASEISVQIFSSNVLVTIVNNDKIKDEFNSLIRSRVTTDIEGYELVETYSDKKIIWVYYRLSKQKYYEQQRLKRLAATQNGLSNYKLAVQSEKQIDYKNALVYYAKTIDAVKLYLNENIKTVVEGVEVNLVVKSFSRLASILSSLTIEAQHKNLDVLFSQKISPEQLTYTLKNANDQPIAGFPLVAYYSERAIQSPLQTTDMNGLVRYSVPVVRSQKKEEAFRVSPDINSILLESSADFTVRKAILEIPYQTLTIPVYIRKPSIRFEIVERNQGMRSADNVLAKTFSNLSIQSGYLTGENAADYICFVEADTKQISFADGIYTCVLTGSVVLTDSKNNIKYTAQIAPVKGMQLSPEKAGMEAYNVLQQQIATRYFREIEEAILK
jgi:hypothetical protein